MAKKTVIDDDEFGLSLSDGDEFGLSLSDEDQPKPEAKDQQDVGAAGSNVENDAEAELSETLQGFQQRAAREDERFWDAVDSEYWVAICFQTREQKEEFLRKTKLDHLGDKYIDGIEVSRIMKIKLESRVPALPQPRPFDAEYVRMAMDLDD